jgi:hypothetical protein
MTRSRARQSKHNTPALSYLQQCIPFADGATLAALQNEVAHSTILSPSPSFANLTHHTADPDQYTLVPATLKIFKVLIEELQAASSNSQLSPTEIEKLEEANSDDGDWEDDPDTVDLTSGSVKAELMAFAEEKPYASRQRDDETQAYLMQFFRNAAGMEGFEGVFAALTGEEQEKLRAYG